MCAKAAARLDVPAVLGRERGAHLDVRVARTAAAAHVRLGIRCGEGRGGSWSEVRVLRDDERWACEKAGYFEHGSMADCVREGTARDAWRRLGYEELGCASEGPGAIGAVDGRRVTAVVLLRLRVVLPVDCSTCSKRLAGRLLILSLPYENPVPVRLRGKVRKEYVLQASRSHQATAVARYLVDQVILLLLLRRLPLLRRHCGRASGVWARR